MNRFAADSTGVIWRLLATFAAGALCACAPDMSFPPPMQRPAPASAKPAMSGLVVRMNEMAGTEIASGILPNDPGAPWRWTGRQPRVRVWPDLADGWRFHARITIVGAVLQKTGRQTVTASVNDHPLEQRTFQQEGTVEFESPIPAGLIRIDTPTLIGLDIGGLLVDASGVERGVLLHEIGLRWVGAK